MGDAAPSGDGALGGAAPWGGGVLRADSEGPESIVRLRITMVYIGLNPSHASRAARLEARIRSPQWQ